MNNSKYLCDQISQTSSDLNINPLPVASPASFKPSSMSAAIRLGRADLVKLLLSRGSSVNREGCHGRRPLHEAAKLGNLGLVELLLGAGAQPDPRSHYGLTPLALAAQGGHREVVEALLLKGGGAIWSCHFLCIVSFDLLAKEKTQINY